MKWSLRIGTLFDIPVFVHATFPLLLVWVAVMQLPAGGVDAAVRGIFFILAIFGCVVLHELGHALAARRFGIRTHDITLLPIGGVARLESMPEKPAQELAVAVAGPAVNVAIAIALGLVLVVNGTMGGLEDISAFSGTFLFQLFAVNIGLVVFNMIPAFPMDGGRVLRAMLTLRFGYVRATQMAAGVGRAFAVLFGVVGLFGNPMLMFIALFVWLGAGAEAAVVERKAILGDVPIERAMLTEFHVVRSTDPLRRASDLTLAGSQRDFPVVEGDRVVGILRQNDLLAGLEQRGGDAPIAEVMVRDYPKIEISDGVESVLARLQGEPGRSLPVVREGRLVGLATLENIAEFMAIRNAMSGPALSRGRS